MSSPASFGTRLRELRKRKGMTQGDLAKEIPCSASHLSRVEKGERPPNDAFALACDRVLGAGGELAALLGDVDVAMRAPEPRSDPAPPPDRRPSAGPAEGETEPGRPRDHYGVGAGDGHVEDLYRVMLSLYQQLCSDGQQRPASDVLSEVLRHTRAIVPLVKKIPGGVRLLPLAARSAELAGWLAQDAGDWHEAIRQTNSAAELGRDGGDLDIVAYTVVRRAEMHMYAGRAVKALSLSRLAESQTGARASTRAAARRCAAQAYAMLGDRPQCEEELAEAAKLRRTGETRAEDRGRAEVHQIDDLIRGWCYYRLGLFGAAAEILREAVAALPERSLRSRGLFGARQARAYAEAKDLERACETGARALACAQETRSVAALRQLQHLCALLGRHSSYAPAESLRTAIVHELTGGDSTGEPRP
ncbi:helix-turn-helix domain-containing protein [Acrocarpospora catenulata]|uniref:helix-turn-helix domain-containing protein n=1 Tax=Acrocarpospora catenulata TaxID=2836182 RepID=UPI00211231C4|nr:helix-turn-helix domain-containing protein [Acrocarpospora catenulata]